MTSRSDFTANLLDGTPTSLAAYDGQVTLIVNTATQCGLTPQLKGLEELHAEFSDAGLAVLGFPCNQFAKQEPRDGDAIGEFCQRNYGVTFPMFEKIEVNGKGAHPLYQWLKQQAGGRLGSGIKWNFTKFLVGRDGQVIKRYSPTTKPDEIRADIEKALV